MNRFAQVSVVFLLMVALAITTSAADGPAPTQASKTGPIQRDGDWQGPRQLSGDAFSLRRRSTWELWRDRDQYRSAILTAARSDDAEEAERAQWILERWRRGILADTPSELARRLAALSPVEAIEALLEAAQFDAATIAMREAYGTLDFEAVSQRVAITLDQRFPVYARAAVQSRRTDELFAFLDVASSTSAMAVCRRDWAMLFPGQPLVPRQPPLTDADGLPSAAETWDGDLVARTEVLLDLIAGDLAAAMESAAAADRSRSEDSNPSDINDTAELEKPSNHPDQPLVRTVRLLTSQWPEMAAHAARLARQWDRSLPVSEDASNGQAATEVVSGRENAIRFWADALIAAERSGASDIRAEAIAGLITHLDALSRIDDGSATTKEVRALGWRVLLIHGEIDAALDVVGQDEPSAAAMIAASASRSAEAFERLGFPADQIDTHLESWIDEAIAAQRELFESMDLFTSGANQPEGSETGVAPEIEKLFTLIRLLDRVNLDGAAWRIADRLSLEDLHVQRPQSSSHYLMRDYVMLSLLWTTHSDWMIRLGMRDWESEPTLISRNTISQITVPESYQILWILQQFVELRRPQVGTATAFQIACEIARAGEEDRRQHAGLVAELAQSLRDGSLRRRVAAEPELARLFRPTAKAWSDLFAAHGRPDLAEPLLRSRSGDGDINAALTLAKEYRMSAPAAIGRQFDDEIWDAVAQSSSDGNPRFRDDVMTAVSAVGEQLRAARDAGDQRTADRLLVELRAMACTPSTDMRQQIAEIFAELGQWQIADEIYRSLFLITALGSEETLSMFEIARKYQGFVAEATASSVETTESAFETAQARSIRAEELQLREQAIGWLDIAFASSLDQAGFQPQLYLVFSRLIAREQFELVVEQAGPTATREAIVRFIERLQQLDSMDITMAESILPRLEEIGMQDLVVEELQRMIEAADLHLDIFPADAVTANNVAWGAAVNHVELDDALRLSRHAVRFEPDSAIYRDTLAEILARQEQYEQALRIERGCVIDDPGQWHLHEQVKRFQQKLSKSR
ncbi:tetratricopeptide repeat protein [Allorhodopirellula solitaria]|uniref:Tetratricopeptide repeat protein n=1 Tax=Allorhodopirellula solitaria TaxID=2527987 RepID=A0A5C5YDJ4_9BACT|nr:O-linked GlcNAc transferase [Allorhodopirellula solitaria]TWT72873.1 hypothetical protein CA85_13340 [Allorhodopirellula solitaria]